MIPKIIHYCWFGRNPLPESAIKCINSWKKYFPDYEIREWNEDNFDVNILPYTQEAYQAKKYAFVSDYARIWVLYYHGGLYFDTDVEVINTFDDILNNGAFLGFEINPNSKTKYGAINPGLGLGCEKQHPLLKLLLSHYENLNFLKIDGSYNTTYAIVNITTNTLRENGLQQVKGIQSIMGVTLYPQDYFNPLNDATGKLCVTKNTHSIHWFSKTWCDVSPFRTRISRMSHRVLGVTFVSKVKRLLKICFH